jgi:hypothetical protein
MTAALLRDPLSLVLAALTAGILLVSALLPAFGPDGYVDGGRQGAAVMDGETEAQIAPPAPAPAAADYHENLERPLFREDRRPYVAPLADASGETTETPEPAPQGTPAQFELLGIVINEETRIAMLRNKAGGETRSAPEGGEVDGWNVEEIAGDHVTMRSAGQVETLQLERKNGPEMPQARAKSLAERRAKAREARRRLLERRRKLGAVPAAAALDDADLADLEQPPDEEVDDIPEDEP